MSTPALAAGGRSACGCQATRHADKKKGGDPDDPGDVSIVFEDPEAEADPGPRSVQELAGAFAALGRFDGVTAILSGGAAGAKLRDRRLRITGQARVRVTVR
jgi:hypothetical protein